MWTVAKFSLLEAYRYRLWLLAPLLLLAGLGLVAMTGALAIAEQQATEAVLLAAWLRLSAVFLLSLFVLTSMVREIHDQVLVWLLASPVSRTRYFLGKSSAYMLLALALAVLFSVPLTYYAPWPAVALWGFSLVCELSIMALAALLCVLALRNMLASGIAVAGLYLLARLLPGMHDLLRGQTLDLADGTSQTIAWMLTAISYLLPNLAEFGQSSWLIYGLGLSPPWLAIAGETLIYGLLIVAAGLVDLHRQRVD